MNQRYYLFRLLGFPVYLEASFFILAALYLIIGGLSPSALLGTAVFVAAAAASILWHELGHALMARRLGSQGIAIVLHGAGGMTLHKPPPSLRRALLVSAAGPGLGLMLGLLLLAAALLARAAGLYAPLLLARFLEDLIYINIVWSLFNLLPMLPLDGGNILQNLLLLRLPGRRAMEISLATSFLLAVALGLLALWHRWVFVTLICLFSAQHTYQQMGGFGPLARLWRGRS